MIPTARADGWKAGLSILAAAAVGCTVWHYNKHSAKKNIQEKNECVVVSHQLNDVDVMNYVYDMDATCTLTWFKGDYKDANAKLKNRMRLIIEKNPWLQGRIVSKYRIGKGRTCHLSYVKSNGKSGFDIDENLETILPNNSPIHRDESFGELGYILQKAGLMIKNGPHEPVFKATIIPCSQSPNEAFALVVQMSHVVGDGATYYEVLNMLCSNSDNAVVKLIPERIMTSKEMQADALGKEEVGYFFRTPNLMKFVGGTLTNAIMKRPVRLCYGWVDPSKMKDAKESAAEEGDVPFVSTNDVITSWFMTQTECSAGEMAVNLRNRLEGHSDLHAGNYENVLFYRKEDYSSPALIRKSLATLKRVVTKDEELPPWYQDLGANISVVTNWSTFSKPNEIEGCEEDMHLPISCAKYFSSSFLFLIIFRGGVGKLGLLFYQPDSVKGVNYLEFAPFLTKGNE
mmetsp:Transcript_7796/g.11356  ORF Transcript_7796/g.11356 Transcript_7796/m.11356 type:complete len:457 (+) Transcript_7796:207-1577(+)